MSKDLKRIKKRLTNIFTVIVFILLLLLWTIFFTFKYFKFISDERKEFSRITMWIKNNLVSVNDFISFWKRIDRWFILREKREEINKDNVFYRKFINVIHLDVDNNVIDKLIKDDLSWLDLNVILNNRKFYNIKEFNDFLITKVSFNNWEKVILIKSLRYSNNDYISDMIWFIIIILLFSIGLYYIWYKFVDKIMKPVEDNLADMKDFIHNAWHELKTPISVIDSNIQLLNKMKTYDKNMNKEIKSEVIKLNWLIDSLINLSDIDSLSISDNNNLLSIVSDCINNYNKNIIKKNITIDIDISKKIQITANKNNLYILISNLIWNSIKYNKQDWSIKLSYVNGVLNIKDSWIWISEKNIDKIYDRFFKEDKSRWSEWFWIWLALVKKICDIYWWKINLKSNKWKGTTFMIKFK